ncbi:MAG: RHS repeat-associated core domain-containing protein, partial [Planctomycetota bacterium]
MRDDVISFGPGLDDTQKAVELTYDDTNFGRLVSASSLGAGDAVLNQILLDYDNLGRVEREHQSHSGVVDTLSTPSVGYGYTSLTTGAMRLAHVEYLDGRQIGYEYDDLGRLASVTDTAAGGFAFPETLETYTYLGLGTLVERARPDGDYFWTLKQQPGDSGGSDSGDAYVGLDRFNRVKQDRWFDDAGTLLDGWAYTYDPNGNRLSKTNLLAGSRSEIYHGGSGLDKLGRMTDFARGSLTADGTAMMGPINRAQSFTYDAQGNQTSTSTGDGQNDPVVSRTHNAQNQLTGVGGVGGNAVTYDANGQMTTDEQGRTLVYDAWDRLVRVEDAGTVVTAYTYDAAGRRISEGTGTNARQLFYSGGSLIEERDSSGATVSQYVNSPVWSNALILRDRDADGSGGGGGSDLEERLYATNDAMFNTTALVDDSGDVMERFQYDAFGQADALATNHADRDGQTGTDAIGSAHGWVNTFQGGRADEAAGLTRFGVRDYDPSLARWGSSDPAGQIDGPNTYAFVGNNPGTYADPTGMYGQLPGGGPGLGLGAATGGTGADPAATGGTTITPHFPGDEDPGGGGSGGGGGGTTTTPEMVPGGGFRPTEPTLIGNGGNPAQTADYRPDRDGLPSGEAVTGIATPAMRAEDTLAGNAERAAADYNGDSKTTLLERMRHLHRLLMRERPIHEELGPGGRELHRRLRYDRTGMRLDWAIRSLENNIINIVNLTMTAGTDEERQLLFTDIVDYLFGPGASGVLADGTNTITLSQLFDLI